MKKIFASSLLFFTVKALALVDYSTPVTEDPAVQSAIPKSHPVSSSKVPRINSSNSSSSEKNFSISTGLENLNISYKDQNDKVSLYSINGHFQTPYNIFLDFSYWSASTDSSNLSESNKQQWGNPTFKLGFNWLTFGAAQDQATIDFYAGAMLPGQKKSDFASSRLDKIAGVEVTKRFYDFALQLGYEIRLPSAPKAETETSIGNIQKITAALGWKVSEDIRFAVEGVMYKIGHNDLNISGSTFSKDLEVSYVSPKVSLGLASFVDLELGALYQTRKVEIKDDLVQARLWDLKGLYGNSLFANLSFSL